MKKLDKRQFGISMYKTAVTALAELTRRTILTSTGKLSERDDGYGGNPGKEDR